MTKEDKLFFTGLIKGLEGRFDGLKSDFDSLEGHFGKLEKRVEENYRGIRYNGMLIEQMRDDITLIREADSFQTERNAKIDAMFESMGLELPTLKQTVGNHGKRISTLEAKCG